MHQISFKRNIEGDDSYEEDVKVYLDRYGYPDLFINHGRNGHAILEYLEG